MKQTIQIQPRFRAVLFSALLFLSGCISERSLGPEVTERRSVGAFEAVKVQNGIDLRITAGQSEHIEVKSAKNSIDDLKTEVEDGVLKIYFTGSWGLGRWGEVSVQGQHLSAIQASSGSDIDSETTITADHLRVKCSSGSDIRAKVQTGYLEVECSGGSDAVIGGSADELRSATSGGSDLKAFDLVVREARLRCSGGSDIRIHVTDALYAEASGGSDIAYRGSPEVLEIDTSSGSDVTRVGE